MFEAENPTKARHIFADVTVKKLGDALVLHKNDRPCNCPFRNPVLMPGKIHGTAEVQVPACSNECQFFALIERADPNDGGKFYEAFLSCAGAGLSFYVNEIL
jgi:hypothetical protein